MTWMAWRQLRTSALVCGLLLLAAGVTLAITGPHLSHLYSLDRGCSGYACGLYSGELLRADLHVRLIGTALIAMPAVLGLFIGAPLVSREMESGTYRLAWTQGVSRTRWIMTRIGLGGLAVAVATGLLTFAFTWWAIPFDHTSLDRIVPSTFDQRGIVPVAYALFAFGLGVAAGAVIRRTIAAMAVTLAGFIAVRFVVQDLLRQHLVAPLVKALPFTQQAPIAFRGTPSGFRVELTGWPDVPHAWVLGAKLVDASGHPPSTAFTHTACSAMQQLQLAQVPQGPVFNHTPSPQMLAAVGTCVHNIGLRFHEAVSYQPGSRFWELQWLESAIFVGLAVALVGLAVYWVRRRLV